LPDVSHKRQFHWYLVEIIQWTRNIHMNEGWIASNGQSPHVQFVHILIWERSIMRYHIPQIQCSQCHLPRCYQNSQTLVPILVIQRRAEGDIFWISIWELAKLQLAQPEMFTDSIWDFYWFFSGLMGINRTTNVFLIFTHYLCG